jgi:outer membrane protein TolC
MTRINIQQAEENYRVTDEKFKEGMTTNTELLDANILLTQAKTDYISALVEYKIALSGLKKSTGEFYEKK